MVEIINVNVIVISLRVYYARDCTSYIINVNPSLRKLRFIELLDQCNYNVITSRNFTLIDF